LLTEEERGEMGAIRKKMLRGEQLQQDEIARYQGFEVKTGQRERPETPVGEDQADRLKTQARAEIVRRFIDPAIASRYGELFGNVYAKRHPRLNAEQSKTFLEDHQLRELEALARADPDNPQFKQFATERVQTAITNLANRVRELAPRERTPDEEKQFGQAKALIKDFRKIADTLGLGVSFSPTSETIEAAKIEDDQGGLARARKEIAGIPERPGITPVKPEASPQIGTEQIAGWVQEELSKGINAPSALLNVLYRMGVTSRRSAASLAENQSMGGMPMKINLLPDGKREIVWSAQGMELNFTIMLKNDPNRAAEMLFNALSRTQ